MSAKPGVILEAKKTTKSIPSNKLVPRETTTTDLGEIWNREAGGVENNKTKMLLSMNLQDRYGGLSAADPDLSKNVGKTNMQLLEEKKRQTNRDIQPGAERIGFSAKMALNKALTDAFRAADKMGLRSPQQFEASFEELMKVAPEARTYFLDPKVREAYPNIKQVAGQLYKNLLDKRGGSTL